MKNVFDINVNTNEYDGVAFYSRKVSPELERQLNALWAEANNLLKKVSPYLVIESVLVVVSAVVVLILFDGGISEILEFSWKSWVSVGLIVLIAVIHFINKNRRAVLIDKLNMKCISKETELQQIALEELQIPETRFEIEVLRNSYELVKDWKYMKNKGYFENPIVDVYQRDDFLCFFTGLQEIAIPFETIDKIHIVRKKIVIEEWLKDIEYNDELYKAYGVRLKRTNDMGYIISAHFQVLIGYNDEEYEILVPNYEEEAMRKIVDMVKPYKQ